MAEKKLTYKAETMSLPALRTVLGDVPTPDPSLQRGRLRPAGEDKITFETKRTLAKLIGHFKLSE